MADSAIAVEMGAGGGQSHDKLTDEIVHHWSTAQSLEGGDDAIPRFLDTPLLLDLVGTSSNVVVQVLDMRRFKSVYVSPNVLDVVGFTPAEINERGVWQWLRNLTLREAIFQAKNARLLGRVQKGLPPRAHFHSAMINSGVRAKDGTRKRIVCQNLTVDWDEHGRATYQLFLWRDATHLFKTTQVVVRHTWRVLPSSEPIVWTYDPEKGKFAERDLFSDRERTVLELVEHGLGSKDIAEKLGISPFTVDNHRKNMIGRFQVKTMEGLIEIGKWLRLI